MKKLVALSLILLLALGIVFSGNAEPAADLSEFVELKMVMVGDQGPSYEYIIPMINEKLKEDLNCSLTIEFLSWGDWQTKYPLMFGSGEEFDMVYTSNWAQYGPTATKGGFLKLDRADIEKYMPLTNANFTDDMWKGAMVVGEVYMIPQTALQFTGDHNLFLVRGDLMKKYGIAEIKTAEDLRAYWDAVVKNDPHMIPIAASNTWTAVDIVNTMMGGYPWLGETWGNGVYQVFDSSDPDNLKPVPDDEYWAYIVKRYETAREYLNAGYWSRDALSQTDDVNVMFKTGVGASTLGAIVYLNEIYQEVNAKNPEWEIQMVDINPDLAAQFYPVTGDGMAFHAQTKHKERAMMCLDLLSYDQEYYDLMYYGVKDKDYTLNEDGSFNWVGEAISVGLRGMNNNVARPSADASPIFVETLERFKNNSFLNRLNNFQGTNDAVVTEVAAVNVVSETYDHISNLGFIEGDIGEYIAKFREELHKAGLATYQADSFKQMQEYLSLNYGSGAK